MERQTYSRRFESNPGRWARAVHESGHTVEARLHPDGRITAGLKASPYAVLPYAMLDLGGEPVARELVRCLANVLGLEVTDPLALAEVPAGQLKIEGGEA